ncbi:MAG: LysM peptidoglycan-binding domain-containing protein [Salinivenus sp.]
MSVRLPSGLLLLLCALVIAGLSGCTSDASSPDAPADTTSTVSAPTAPDSSTAPAPTKALASVERGEDTRSVAQKLEDTSTKTRVKRALVQTSSLRVFSFRPTVVNGHLVLRGDVNTADQYRQAERIARQVDGVDAFTNQVTMGGRPVTEERLNSTEEAAETDEAAVYHTVQEGDTLWEIAREHRASVQQIQRLNDLGPSSLRPGQRIRVR